MAVTQADVDALRKAYYSGILTVRSETGRTTTYQDSAALRAALDRAEDELAGESGTPSRRKVYITDAPRQKGWT